MKFLKLDSNVTVDEQIEKVKEEVQEFYEAVENKDSDNTIEEFYDIIQSMLGVISILGLENALHDGLMKHNEKLISRGWELQTKDKKIYGKINEYIYAVQLLIDNLEYMMEGKDFNIDKLKKRIDIVKRFENKLVSK